MLRHAPRPGLGLPTLEARSLSCCALPAPAVFKYTGPACPERHLECAAILGADVSRAKSDDGEHAGALLAEQLIKLMETIGLPLGLSPVGFQRADVDALVDGTLPQQRLTKMAPLAASRDALGLIFEDALAYNK